MTEQLMHGRQDVFTNCYCTSPLHMSLLAIRNGTINENWFHVSIRHLSVNEIYNITHAIKS